MVLERKDLKKKVEGVKNKTMETQKIRSKLEKELEVLKKRDLDVKMRIDNHKIINNDLKK